KLNRGWSSYTRKIKPGLQTPTWLKQISRFVFSFTYLTFFTFCGAIANIVLLFLANPTPVLYEVLFENDKSSDTSKDIVIGLIIGTWVFGLLYLIGIFIELIVEIL